MNKQTFADEAALLEVKTNELIALLQKGVVDASHAKSIRQKLLKALDEASFPQKLEAFQELDAGRDRIALLNDFEYLLSQHQLDSAVTTKYLTQERVKKFIAVIMGLIMITLGLTMIIMPAPPYFEMFTVFYFNPNDGVTIMDIISLLIVFTGIYVILNAVLKKQSYVKS